jgi:NADH:ubiquinone oxidoreductase subunit 6 (subunit J)
MDKKQKNNMWICGMFGWLAVTIGLRLSTRSNSIIVGMAMLIFLIVMIKDRKRLAGFDIVGRICFLAGGVLGFSVMTGILQGVPLAVWALGVLALFGIGVVLMGWGAHLKNPENVSKKKVCVEAGFMIFILVYFGILFTY